MSAETHEAVHRHEPPTSFIRKYIFSLDHKVIGIQYAITGLLFLLVAAGAGIGAFFTPTAYGTKLAEGKETRRIGERDYVLEYPIHADYALIKADRADRWVYRLAPFLEDVERSQQLAHARPDAPLIPLLQLRHERHVTLDREVREEPRVLKDGRHAARVGAGHHRRPRAPSCPGLPRSTGVPAGGQA
mgnify:CR=1 FL=1